MDLVSDFFGGYMSGVFTMGLGAIMCVTVAHRLAIVTKLLSAFAHASTTLTTVMLVYSVITKNDKDTLFYATALLMNVAYACMTIYSSGKIRVSGDKGSGFIEFDNSDPDHMLINGSKLKRGGGFGKSSNNISQLLSNRPELTGTNREKLLSTVQDYKLAIYINEVYRPGASVGDGGTADKLIAEFYVGDSKHLPKAKERLIGIKRIISSENLGLNDLDIAEALRDDLEYAIGLFE